MRLIVVLLFINWFLTVINSNSFSSDYHNQESVRIRSNDISTPLLLSSIPTVIPKKQGKSPFGMKIFIDSFLNRMKRMNSTPIQPICNKEEALKRYRTVF